MRFSKLIEVTNIFSKLDFSYESFILFKRASQMITKFLTVPLTHGSPRSGPAGASPTKEEEADWDEAVVEGRTKSGTLGRKHLELLAHRKRGCWEPVLIIRRHQRPPMTGCCQAAARGGCRIDGPRPRWRKAFAIVELEWCGGRGKDLMERINGVLWWQRIFGTS